MTLAEILAAIQLAESLYAFGASALSNIEGDLSADDLATVKAQVASSGANIDAARATIDALAAKAG